MSKLSLCLWFDGRAEEAAEFYVATFRACGQPTEMGAVSRYGEAGPGPKGSAMMATCTLGGWEIMGLNGGPNYSFTPAVSLVVSCADQAEVDGFWNRLCEGGAPSRCGWLTDRFGVSWQIVPKQLGELMSGPDAARSGRVMQAMLKMIKIEVAELQMAYDG